MSKALAEAGHEVHVLTWDRAILEKAAAMRPGVHFHAIEWDRPPTSLAGYPSHPVRHAMGVYDTLRELHARHRFEYIEYPDFGGEGHFVGRARRTMGEFADAVIGVRLHASVEWLMQLNRTERVGKDWVFNRHIEAQAIRDADVAIAPSRAMIDVVKRQLGANLGAPTNRPGRVIQVVHNPFDSSLLGEARDGGVKHLRDEPPVLLCVGRIAHQKGTHIFVDAVLRLLDSGRDVRARIMGGDTPTGPLARSMLATLREMIPARHAAKFEIHDDQHPRHVLLEQIREATVCVYPSLWENFPYACAEAMASGATVLGSDGGGIPEMIENGVNGMLFRSEDAADCAEKMARLLDDPGLAKRLASAAPARIAQLCDPARAVRETIEAVEQSRRSAEQGLRPSRVTSLLPPRDASVLIPVSETTREDQLERTLASVLEQRAVPREVIIALPGSANAGIMESAARLAQNPRKGIAVQCVTSAARTPGAVRNAGFAAADSRLVLLVTPGDTLDARLLGTLTDAMATEPSASFAASLTRYQKVDGEVSQQSVGIWIGIDRDALPVMNCAGPAMLLMVRDHVLAAGGFDETLPAMETWELFCSLAQRGGTGVIVPQFMVDAAASEAIDPVVHDAIRDAINWRHPTLSTNPGWTIRLMQCDRYSPDVVPYDVIRENLRYRLADKANVMLKSLGIQKFFKRIVMKSEERAGKTL
ncbi:MAG: glycosyltransferase [Planctomycetes bacterium]|nr:glycosyltransferase [Planctomycetota bacterium]